ncbi:MAG: hypothetical protein KGI29_02240 [Pseudomonadota bacterium]|nr:hypothetical protein [Pseudomonadota bacterium]MDE3037207.1 hypothetical protein [Pseudomonadota bacterium]
MRQALALQPIVSGYTPLSSVCSDRVRAFLRPFAVSADSEIGNTDEKMKRQKILAEWHQFIDEINLLHSWTRNWDGNGSAKPKSVSIKNAKNWGRKIYSLVAQHDYEWRKPFISTDEEGDLVLEWWYKDRNLTLDISGNEVIFSETRNADNSPKITTGILTNTALPSKLRWLILGV